MIEPDEVAKSLNKLSLGITESNRLLALLSGGLVKLNSDFGKMPKSIADAIKNIKELNKGIAATGVESKKTKKNLEETWVDIIDGNIVKTLEKQLKVMRDLTAGADKLGDTVKKVSDEGFDVFNAKDMVEQVNAIKALDDKVKSLASSASKMANTDIGIKIKGSETVREINLIKREMDTLITKMGLAGSVMEDSFDFNDNIFIDRLKELGKGFDEEWSKITEGAKKAKEEIESNLKTKYTVPTLTTADTGGANPAVISDNLQAKFDTGNLDEINIAMKALKEMGKEPIIEEMFTGSEEYAAIYKKLLPTLNTGRTNIEKAYIAQKLLTASTKDMGKAYVSVLEGEKAVAKLKEKTARETISRAGKSGAGAFLGGWAQGGFKGGMSAMSDSIDRRRKDLLESGLTKEEKSEGMKKLGYKVSTDKEGNMSYSAGAVTRMAQLQDKGLSGLFKNEAGSLSGGIADGAGGELAGLGEAAAGASTALMVAAGVIMAAVALFKIWAAVMDHVAKNYREVKKVGGMSGMLGNRELNSEIDLRKEAARFRKNLATGGGVDMHPSLNKDGFYMLLEKKLEILSAAQGAGISGALMHKDVNSEGYQKEDAENYSAVAKYLQTSATAAELLGKDIKEAAAEVATLHEELSMSFEGVELFLGNITKSAAAAGVSNEKFMKITRGLANEQVNYGTELKNTARLLATLGESGKYTSETLKKAFEALIPDKQTNEQKVVSTMMAMRDKATVEMVKADIQNSLNKLDQREKDLDEIIRKDPKSSAAQDAQKEKFANISKRSGLIEGKAGWASGNAYQAAGAEQYLSPQAKLLKSYGALGSQFEQLKGVMKKGGTTEDYMAALRKVPKITRDMLAGSAYGVNEDSIKSLGTMVEGNRGNISKAFFDDNGKTRDAVKSDQLDKDPETKKKYLSILTSTGKFSDTEAIGLLTDIQAGGARAAKAQETLEGLWKTKDGKTMYGLDILQASQKAGDLSAEMVEYNKSDSQKLKELAKQSNTASTDISDRMKQWMEPYLETANSALADMVSGFSNSNKDFKQAVEDRKNNAAVTRGIEEAKATQAKKNSAQEALDITQSKLESKGIDIYKNDGMKVMMKDFDDKQKAYNAAAEKANGPNADNDDMTNAAKAHEEMRIAHEKLSSAKSQSYLNLAGSEKDEGKKALLMTAKKQNDEVNEEQMKLDRIMTSQNRKEVIAGLGPKGLGLTGAEAREAVDTIDVGRTLDADAIKTGFFKNLAKGKSTDTLKKKTGGDEALWTLNPEDIMASIEDKSFLGKTTEKQRGSILEMAMRLKPTAEGNALILLDKIINGLGTKQGGNTQITNFGTGATATGDKDNVTKTSNAASNVDTGLAD